MNKTDLLNIYNKKYADNYNEKFLTNDFSKLGAEFEYDTLKGLINQDTVWLDVACGTGYFLSRFPGIKRAGMDISPDMLAKSQEQNPDALFFREWDFRNDAEDWAEKWSLISCMWWPYSYVESIGEVEKSILNMVKWLQKGGDFFLPIGDFTEFRPSIPSIPYEEYEEVFKRTILITSFTWTWLEDGVNNEHRNLIAPHIDHIIRLIEPYFETIEVVRYPVLYDGWVSRSAIVAKNKCNKDINNSHKANIIKHPIPYFDNPNKADNSITKNDHIQEILIPDHKVNIVDKISSKQLIKELSKRVFTGHLLKSLLIKMHLKK
jgi:SAM-dependent methyltransferase